MRTLLIALVLLIGAATTQAAGPYNIGPGGFNGRSFATRYGLTPDDFSVLNNQLFLRPGLTLPDDPPIIDPALSPAEVAAAANLQARVDAIANLTSDKTVSFKLFRAVVGIMLDELNLHAAKINAILTAIDNGSTLAGVKTNIAAIADYPTRTQAQLITAIETKINSGTVD